MAFSLDLKRVLISDSVDSCCKTIIEANGIAVDLKTKLTKEELLAEIPVRESWSTCTDKICVLNRFVFGFYRADLFCFRTMMVWLFDQLLRWLQKWSRLEKNSKSSVAQEQALTTSIFQQLHFKELLLWSKLKLNSRNYLISLCCFMVSRKVEVIFEVSFPLFLRCAMIFRRVVYEFCTNSLEYCAGKILAYKLALIHNEITFIVIVL